MTDRDDPAHAPTEVMTPSDAPTAASEHGTAPHAQRPAIDLDSRVGDRYTIKELLGTGGMGAVYRAYDETLGEDVALKVMRQSIAASLRDEVRLAQRVTHRNVCRTYDLEDVGGRHFLKMEYIAGETLAARLARARLPIADAVRIARAIADGLGAAHAEGIVHRDLKPGNVMLAGERVVLMDFGLALRASGDETDRSGTPGYMSPEQLAGRAVDARSDLYALGCVAYEAVTGERVAGSTDVRDKRAEAPRWLARAIEDLLALDPAVRPRGARRLARGPRGWKLATAGTLVLAAAVIALWKMWPHELWRADIRPIPPMYEENSTGPALSPDATEIAFDSASPFGDKWTIYRQRLDGSSPLPVALPEENCIFPRWIDRRRLAMRCGDDIDGHVWEVDLDGGPSVKHGPGIVAVPCGDTMLVALMRDGLPALVLRKGEVDQPVATVGEVQSADCVRDGARVAWVVGSPGALMFLERGEKPRELASGQVLEIAFTPGGRSIVYALREGQMTDLWERVVGEPEPHRLTRGAQARAPSISSDGRELVYDQDVTSLVLIEHSAAGAVQKTTRVEQLAHQVVTPDGKRVVAFDADTERVLVIDLASGDERELARGRLPTVSHDGRRVFFVTSRDRKLYSVPIDGPAATPVFEGEIPGEIDDLVDAADGLHLNVRDDAGPMRALVLGPDRQLRDEGGAGLVVPAPSGGWRAVYTIDGNKLVMRVVAPGQPLSAPAFTRPRSLGRPAWVDAHTLSYCDLDGCYRIDVTTQQVLARVPHTRTTTPFAASPDGEHWYETSYFAHVSRNRIVNFASRPWAPKP